MQADSTKMSVQTAQAVPDECEKVQWRFTWTKLKRLASVTLWLAYTALLFFAITGTTVFSMRPFVQMPLETPSFLLFPGSALSVPILDIFYLVVLGFWILHYIIGSCLEWNWDRDLTPKCLSDLQSQLTPPSRALLALCVSIVFHVSGNMHYQFYYCVGVIPLENRFAIFDIRSFACGPAGLILIAAVLSVAYALFYVLRYVFTGQLCFEKVVVAKSAANDIESGSATQSKLASHLHSSSESV